MIYEYEIQYDSSGNITEYLYKILTGYTTDDIYDCDLNIDVSCDPNCTVTCDNETTCTISCSPNCTVTSNGTVDLGPAPIYTTFKLKADGVTDDRVQLQLLLDEINNQGGGTLVLPAGKEILINSSSATLQAIVVYSNIIITSDSKKDRAILSYGSTASRFISSRIDYLNDPNEDEVYYPISNFELSNVIIRSAGGTAGVALLHLRNSQVGEINENITISNCDFEGSQITASSIYITEVTGLTIDNCSFTNGKTMIRIVETSSNNDIVISNCDFSGSDSANACIQTGEVSNLTIENCNFSNGNLGINLVNDNRNVYIKNNIFEASLTNNPIRVSAGSQSNQFTESLWIIGNDIRVQRAENPYLENPFFNFQRYEDGRVIWSRLYTDTVPKPIGNSAINITGSSAIRHQNVVIADNIANGPDYGFFDGGSGDLFSIKDVIRLKCYGNTARNSGDLGFAIERCHFGVVSNNTADRNNSCGISVFDSTHINVTGNVCSDNELARDGIYKNNPYGGIRVERESRNILVEGNYCYANSGVRRSFVNSLSPSQNEGADIRYNLTTFPTQQYGVVVKNGFNLLPSNVKIGINHNSGLLWGPDYTNIKASQMLDVFTGDDAPTEGDYPLGTRLRNNLNSSSTAGINEWQVVNRVEMKLVANSETDTNAGTSNIIVQTLNSNSTFVNNLIENNDTATILANDIIGIMLDDFSVHWAKVVSVTSEGGTPEQSNIQFTPALPSTASYTTTSLTINGVVDPVDVVDTKTAVCLRWEEVK